MISETQINLIFEECHIYLHQNFYRKKINGKNPKEKFLYNYLFYKKLKKILY